MARTRVMAFGDSILDGTGSTAALHSAGSRWVLDQSLTALGKSIQFCGARFQGTTFENNADEAYSGQAIATIQVNSRRTRRIQHPDGIIILAGTNNLTAGTSAALGTAYTTTLAELWDMGAHAIPPGGVRTLKWIICVTILKRNDDLVTVNPRVIDFNTNVLPPIVATHQALGRDVVIADGYTAVDTTGGDGIHPLDAGHTQLANLLLPLIAARANVST